MSRWDRGVHVGRGYLVHRDILLARGWLLKILVFGDRFLFELMLYIPVNNVLALLGCFPG